jgi:hypothetical protein
MMMPRTSEVDVVARWPYFVCVPRPPGIESGSGACRRAQLQRTEKTSRAHKRSDGASETSGARPVRAAARERPRPMVRG